MNAYLIKRWQDTVRPDDEVWVLGDFGFSNSYGTPLDSIFAQLPGRKYLVSGNHDAQNPKVMELGWEKVRDLTYITYKIQPDPQVKAIKKKAMACHFPIQAWDGTSKGTIMLHGHTHGNLRDQIPWRFDVGVDANPEFDYAPIPIEHFFKLASKQTFIPQDHHY